MKLRVATLVGGVAYDDQERRLAERHDLIVATPGRLRDHMEKGRVDFRRLEIFVLDEADRMLDLGFIDAIEAIHERLPVEKQTLLFSATLGDRVERIARKLLRDPVHVREGGVRTRRDDIRQVAYLAESREHKLDLLLGLLEQRRGERALVFTATKRTADHLARELRARRLSSDALHGDMSQGARNRTLDRFRRGTVEIVVATDVAARGLDVEGLGHVINFDLPDGARDYVHRIGRTARAGATGVAISLVEPRDRSRMRQIETGIGRTLERSVIGDQRPDTSDVRIRQVRLVRYNHPSDS
jgi:superfamily II DNA/RNA helicase